MKTQKRYTIVDKNDVSPSARWISVKPNEDGTLGVYWASRKDRFEFPDPNKLRSFAAAVEKKWNAKHVSQVKLAVVRCRPRKDLAHAVLSGAFRLASVSCRPGETVVTLEKMSRRDLEAIRRAPSSGS